MKKRITALLILFTLLIGALPVSAINTSGINYIPVNYTTYVYNYTDGTTEFDMYIENVSDKTITGIGVTWYPRNSWGLPIIYEKYQYFTSSRNNLDTTPGEYEYISWRTNTIEYRNASEDYTTAAISLVNFSDGTTWTNDGYYGTPEFEIENDQTRDGRYLVNSEEPDIWVKCTGTGVYKDDWYVWNDGQGWVWFRSGNTAWCSRWGSGGSIKHVVNENPNLYSIQNFQIAHYPIMQATFYGSGHSTYKSTSYKYANIDMPNNSHRPFYVGLWDAGNDPYIKSRRWYIKLEGSNSYVPFSSERGPTCQVWQEGTHEIKLEYNNDPNYYSIIEFEIER